MDFNYPIKIIDRKIQELEEDDWPFMKFIVQHRIKELEAVRKILTEGTGYLVPSATTKGSKIMFYNEL